MKNYELLKILSIFLISLVVFLFFLGFSYSNPFNSNWLTSGDLTAYLDGWHFFKKDVWRFPIGSLPNYGVNAGNSIVYSDIIPFFAIIFKVFRGVLSNDFQYFSLWIFLSIFLQSFFSYLIIFKSTNNFLYSIIGSIFFSISPVFFQKLGSHLALASHWLILCSFYIETLKKKKNIYRNSIIIFSITVHFSLTIILVMFHYLFKLKELLETKKIKYFLMDNFVLGFSSILLMYALGYFEIPPEDGLGGGYGYFSLNLNSFFNPVDLAGGSWSLFLPILKSYGGQYEGFAYLGLSGISFFIIFLTCFFLKNNNFLFNKRIAILIFLIFFILAISNKIYFGDNQILNIHINKYLYGVLGLVRASGRLIWPIYYLIFFTGIIFIYKKFNKNISILILSILLIIQMMDLSPGYKKYFKGQIFPNESNLIDPIWNELPEHFDYARIIEIINAPNLYWRMPNYLGKSKFKKTDIVNGARVDRAKLEESSYTNTIKLSKGIIENNEVYFIDNRQHLLYLKLILKDKPNYHFYFRDKIWVLTNKNIINKNLLELKLFNNLQANLLPYYNEKNIKYNLNDGYQGVGWKKTDNGIATRGYLSSLMFSLNQNSCKKSTLLNVKFNKKFKEYSKFDIKTNISVNKTHIKQIDFKKHNSNIFTIEIPCNKNDINYLIEFEMLNVTSLRDSSQHLNPQKLGFEILNIKLVNQ